MVKSKKISYIFCFVCFILLLFLYIFYLRGLVILAYQGDAPEWFNWLIDQFFPRFIVEKQRFELAFFLNKADQIIIRSSLLMAAGLIFGYYYSFDQIIENKIQIHTASFYKILIFIFYCGLLYFSWNWYTAFEGLVKLAPFYRAVHIFKIFSISLPPLWLLYLLFSIYIGSILAIICGIRSTLLALIIAFISFLIQGYFNSFEKIEHGQVTLTYATFLMPLMIYELNKKAKGNDQPKLKTWGLNLIQWTIALVYLFSGLEKLMSSGLNWANAHTFRTYLNLHPTELGAWVAKSDFLCVLLPSFALLFQLGFIMISVFPRWKYVFLLSGLLFHLGTKLLMDIGPYFSSWVFVYIFFIDWDHWMNKGFSLIRSKHKNRLKGM